MRNNHFWRPHTASNPPLICVPFCWRWQRWFADPWRAGPWGGGRVCWPAGRCTLGWVVTHTGREVKEGEGKIKQEEYGQMWKVEWEMCGPDQGRRKIYQDEEASVIGIHQSRKSDRVGWKGCVKVWSGGIRMLTMMTMMTGGTMTILLPSAPWAQWALALPG